MNCLEVQDLLSPYLDHVLTPEENSFVEKHLKICASCRKALADLKETIAIVQSLSDVPLPAGFQDQIHQMLVKANKEMNKEKGFNHRERWWQRFSRSQRMIAAVAAAVMIICVSAFGTFVNQSPKLDMAQMPSIMNSELPEEKAGIATDKIREKAQQDEAVDTKESTESCQAHIPVPAKKKIPPLAILLTVTALAVSVLLLRKVIMMLRK